MQRRGRPAWKHSMWQLECACLSPSKSDSFASRVAKFSDCLHSLAQIAELRPAVASEMLGHEIRLCLALSCSPLGHNLLLTRDIVLSMPRRRAHATSNPCEATSCTSPPDEHASPAGFPRSVNTGGALAANKSARAVRGPPNPNCWMRASPHAQAGRRQPPFQRCLLCRTWAGSWAMGCAPPRKPQTETCNQSADAPHQFMARAGHHAFAFAEHLPRRQ